MAVPITQKQADRLLVGKTISRVLVQGPVERNGGGRSCHVSQIRFTDGSCLSFFVSEMEDGSDYVITGTYHGRKAGG